MRRTLVAVVAVVLGYAVMAGLFPRRLAAQPPSFRAGVEVVAIDVSVVDRVGFPVGDLQPADFTVTVDGRPRKIVSAQFLSHRAPGIDEIARAERGEPLPEVVAPGRIGTERDVIIAVDEDSLAAGDGQLAKRAIGRFVNQLMPADRIAIVTLPRLPGRIGLTSESMALNRITAGAIIMAGSGMCTGGRVRFHLKHNLGRAESSIVFVGYAAAGTLARRIIDGAKAVDILGEQVPARAAIYTINGFSAHADQQRIARLAQANRRARRNFPGSRRSSRPCRVSRRCWAARR